MRLCLAAVADRWLLFAIWDISFLMEDATCEAVFCAPAGVTKYYVTERRKGPLVSSHEAHEAARTTETRRRTMPQGGSHEQHVKAGQQSHKNDENRGRQQQAEDRNRGQQDGHRGGSGNFAEDRQRASEAGRKGGHH
jgi:hypothetical protein